MKIQILFLLLISFAAQAAPGCPQAEEGAKSIYKKEFPDVSKSDINVNELPVAQGQLFKVDHPDTCGMRGCEFILAALNKDKCLVLSFSGFGRIKALKKGDFSSFKYVVKRTGVDGPTPAKSFQLNADTGVFSEVK